MSIGLKIVSGVLHLGLHVLCYSGSGIILYSLRRKLSLIPLYIYLGIILVFTSMMSSFYVLHVTEGISVGGGSIAYAAVLWTVLYVYVMERDLSTIKFVILGVLAVQFIFVLAYPYFGCLLDYEGVTNPLDIPPELFNVSFGIFWVGNVLALIEMVLMIFLVEWMRERLPSIPPVIHVAVVYNLTLLIDSVLYPLFAYPVTQSISIVQGLASLLSKLLLGMFYSLMLFVGIIPFRPRYGKGEDHARLSLSDMISLPKTKVIDAWRQAQKNQELVSLLLSILGHDIRNYNAMTISTLEALLMEHPDLDDDVQDMLTEIQKVQYQSTELLKNTLTLESLQKGNVETIPIEIRKVLVEARGRVDESYPHIALLLDGTEALTGLRTRGNELFNVALYNILSNMVKYRKPNQNTVTVEISSEVENGFLHLVLCDQGIGIPDDTKQQVFDSIETRPRHSNFGLYLVKKILSLADSGIRVENRPDSPNDYSKGTAFHLRLPLAKERHAETQTSET